MSLILTKNDGTTDVTYQPLSATGSKQEFVNPSSAVTSREYVMTDHQIRSGIGQQSRHTASVKKVLLSTDGASQGDLIASMTLTIPNIDTFTSASLYDVVKQLVCMCKNASLDKLASGATLDGSDLNVTGPFNPA